jgi:hypothetical protein
MIYNGRHTAKTLSSLDRKGKRIVLGLLLSTPRATVDVESGLLPLHLESTKQAARLAIQLAHSPDPRWRQMSSNSPSNSPVNLIMRAVMSLQALDTTNLPILHSPNKQPICKQQEVTNLITKPTEIWQQLWNRETTGRQYHLISPTVSTKPQPYHSTSPQTHGSTSSEGQNRSNLHQ